MRLRLLQTVDWIRQGSNCQLGTTGDHCERCKEGYYGNAFNRGCQACPCPSVWNNFALACMDIGSGAIECLCKPNYSGTRCERCASGYYGNPLVYGGNCKPCNCWDGTLNICDSLTGECITSGDSSCGDHGYECDSCTHALLVDLERMNDVLARLKRQLQNINHGSDSLLKLNNLEANISKTKILVGTYSTAVKHLDPKLVQLEADVNAVGVDLILDLINMTIHMATNQAVLNQTAASLMASDSSLRDLAELMSHAEDAVNRTQDLNLKSGTTLQHLQHLQAQVEKENSTLPPVTEMTRDLLKNITDIFLMLEEIKLEFENHAAQLDGAKPKLFNKLNHIQRIMAKVDITKVEEHAEELNRLATEFQQVLHNATNSTDLHSFLGTGAYNSIINALEKAEMAANQSSEASEQALKDVKGGGLVNRAEGLKDNSSHLQTEANETQTDLEMLSHTVNAHKDRVNKQKEKGESLRMNISTISDDLKKIKRMESINASFSVLSDNITQIEAFSRELSPGANMTETIRQIKDLIEETRTFVNRLPLATTFNGKGHIELHPPRKPEDLKAFTAVDLLLNLHQNNHSKANRRRKRRQGKHKDANFFVFYLGNKNASGDYIGMAIKRNVLICVYKLGGVVHEVETSQITTTTNVKSFDFDRVMFYRYFIHMMLKVYQDAEVNITRNFTSEKRVSLPLKRNLPNTMTGILDLDPNNLVFYVGGYPEDFTPPAELRYPKYRGAMKLSYINDNPVCLFNYKRAINVNTTQCAVTIPRLQVTDYYEGTGYRKVMTNTNKRILLKFHTNSRETNALLFYIENEESFFYVFVEQGFLKLQGQQAGQELRAQSAEKVSLFGVRAATLYSALSVDSLFVRNKQPISLGFRSKDRHGAILRSRSQGSTSVNNFQLSLSDGYVVFSSDNHTLKSDKRYNDGSWHYLSAAMRPTGLRTQQAPSVDPSNHTVVDTSSLRQTAGSITPFHKRTLITEVKTKSSKGLILHLSGRGVIPLLALYMANGKVKMFLGQERIIFHKQKSNDGQWHKIEFSVESSNFHLLVDGNRVTDGVLPNNEGSALDLHNPVYLGGDPLRKISHIYDIPTDSIIGCIRNFKINEEAIVKPKASHKALPCLDEHNVMGTYFGGGHIILDNYFTAGSDFVLAFELRPQRLTGLLFHVQSHKASLNVFLMENKVGVEVNDGNRAVSVEVTPPQNLCDGKFHIVSVSKKHEVIKLTVDSVSDQRDGPSKLHSTKGSLYIGGIAKQNGSPVSSPFVGCLRNVKIDDRPVAFETGSRVVGLVSINKCPVD
eukprot:superscaffoldBa00000475_g5015